MGSPDNTLIELSNGAQTLLRDATSDDLGCVFGTWLETYRLSLFAVEVPKDIYYPNQHATIERLLKRASITVACNPEDPTSIFGYAVYERVADILVLHWVYVKFPYRGLGIARRMLESIYPHWATHEVAITALPRDWQLDSAHKIQDLIVDRKTPKHPTVRRYAGLARFIFDPYLLFKETK